MKYKIKIWRFIAIMTLYFVTTDSWGYSFIVNGICYNINSDGNSVSVTSYVPPYTVQNEIQASFNGNYAIQGTTSSSPGYYVWTETDPALKANLFREGDPTWKNGNPGYKRSRSSALPEDYPTVPVVGGGMDGTDCIKMHTRSTGSFGQMVRIPLAAGTMFNGEFDSQLALSQPLKATTFGVPCIQKPLCIEADLKYEPGPKFQDTNENVITGVVDEPDLYCVFYRNEDENGNEVVLDGADILTSKYIVGVARLKHYYNMVWNEEEQRHIPEPVFTNSPIHGITNEWQRVSIDVDYDFFQTGHENIIDTNILENRGYSIVIGATSSWCGGAFEGAINSKLYMDNVKVVFEDTEDTILGYLGSILIPSVVTYQGKQYSVTGIDSYAFSGCSDLTSITIPSSVTSIGSYAFSGCSSLTSVSIPNSVTSIGDDAFHGCSSLTKAEFANIESLCKMAFGDVYDNPLYYAKHLYIDGQEVTDVVIPSSVTSIGSYAFSGCSSLTSVSIPNSVTSIGDDAFHGCSSLTKAEFANIESLCKMAFGDVYDNPLYYAKHLYIDGQEVTDVVIPSSVTSIGKYAFYNCSGLTSITIPESVTSIGQYAFSGCTGLKEVYCMPKQVPTTGSNAFNNTNIVSATLYVHSSAIDAYKSEAPWSGFGTIALERVYDFEADGIYYYINSNETSVSVTYKTTSYNSYSGSVAIPATVTYTGKQYSVTSIGGCAFYDCTGLTSITIPNSVTTIGENIFYGCTGLTVTINSNQLVSKIYTSSSNLGTVFGSQVKEVIIGNDITSIGSYAFYNTGLKSVTIGTGVLSIATNAFSFDVDKGSKPIKVIWLTNTPPSGYNNVGGTVNYVANNLYTSLSNVTVYPFLSSVFEVEGIKYVPVSPSERTCDAIDCTSNTDVKQINIAETVSYKGVAMKVQTIKQYACYGNKTIEKLNLSFNGSVENNAFCGCTSLQSATINNKGYIGARAFCGCTSLQSATINNKGYIGARAFYGCTGLQHATINNNGDIGESAFENSTGSTPATFEISNAGDIGTRAFYGCTGLQSATINNKGNIGTHAFYGCTALKAVTLGNEIPSIRSFAFYNCYNLKNIDIPDAVQTIDVDVFHGCWSMKTATIGNGVTAIPYSAFSGCSSLTDIKIGQSTKTFGKYSFQNCSSLPKIEIPKSVTSINDYTFSGCTALATVIMEDREDNTVLNLGSNGSSPIFADCRLDSVYIGRNISYNTSSSYGYSPFYRNTSLRSVTITDKETEISPNEFYGCTNLTNVRIGDGVTTIGNWAFSGCSNFDYFAFGQNVKTIGQEAFSDCTAITKIIAKATTPPTCGSQALDDINKWECTLYVPTDYISAYQQADQWKDFFFMEEEPDYILGDANGNGEVEIGDITSVLTLMATPDATGYNNKAADANQNGEIEIGDITTILTIMAGGE